MTPGRRSRRWIGVGAGIALGMLLLGVSEARAAKYSVAQCGWHLGNDAEWDQSAGPGKFRPDAYCVTPEDSDPFDGAHLKSFVRPEGGTVSGTRFARWRWVAPAGTGIVNVRGSWWQALHDGFEHRLGTSDGAGGFSVLASADATGTAPDPFAAGFEQPRRTFESRLLCARPADRHCDLDPASFASVRALTLTLADDSAPRPRAGGAIVAPGWRRGTQGFSIDSADSGSGVRLTETLIDGARSTLTEHGCFQKLIGGERRATRMRPCELSRVATGSFATGTLADGPHQLSVCAEDFAGNRACSASHRLLTDNTAPASPAALGLRGGGGWRRSNDFDAFWTNPDQGAASPIAAVAHRLTGPGGYDSGVLWRSTTGIASLEDLKVPRAGAYSLSVWLRDEAGNESPASAARVTLLFDDIAPSAAFQLHRDPAHPEMLAALVADADSGPASGAISYRRAGGGRWLGLPSSLRTSPGRHGEAELIARFPSDRIRPGSYELRATVADGAGNETSTTRRSDGSPMVIRAPLKARARLGAKLRLEGSRGRVLTVPFGARATLIGRLARGDGAGLEGREVRVTIRPAPGTLGGGSARSVRTGIRGGFRVRLSAGPSRRIRVSFPGTEALGRARSAPMLLRVRAGVELGASPHSLRTGEALRLRGRIRTRGTALPPRGKLVSIEYLERASGRWRPVLMTRARRDGRFRARYRFRYVNGVARIRLRALVPPERGWPYAGGASAPVLVVVRG